MSVRGLAKAIGKSPSWLSKVERDLEKPGAGSIRLLAHALRFDASELLRLSGKPELDLAALERIREEPNDVMGIRLFMGHMAPFVCTFTNSHSEAIAKGESSGSLDEAVRRCIAKWEERSE